MDWCVQPLRAADHPPSAGFRGEASRKVVRLEASLGEQLALDAAGSTDPDGHRLAFKWYVYREACTYRGEAALDNAGENKATCAFRKTLAANPFTLSWKWPTVDRQASPRIAGLSSPVRPAD